MTVMRCIKKIDMKYYIDAIEVFELGELLKVNAINSEDATILLIDDNRYDIVNEKIEKIEKVAKALKTKEKEEIDEKMKAIVKRLKEVVNRDVFNFGMPKSEEEINRIIIDNINRYRERHSRDRVSSSSGSNEFNVYADIKRNSGIR